MAPKALASIILPFLAESGLDVNYFCQLSKQLRPLLGLPSDRFLFGKVQTGSGNRPPMRIFGRRIQLPTVTLLLSQPKTNNPSESKIVWAGEKIEAVRR